MSSFSTSPHPVFSLPYLLLIYLLLSWFHPLCLVMMSSCQHLPFVAIIPSIRLTLPLVMIISLTIYSFFLSTPTSFVYLHIDTCLSPQVSLAVVFFTVWGHAAGGFLRYTLPCLCSIYFTLSEPATTPTLVQRTTFCVIAVSWSVLTVIWACDLLHDGPAYYQLCQPDNFFFHLLCDLNQGSLPPKPITLPTVLATLRCWCEE